MDEEINFIIIDYFKLKGQEMNTFFTLYNHTRLYLFFFKMVVFICTIFLIKEVEAKNSLQDLPTNVTKRRTQTINLRDTVGIIVTSNTDRIESGTIAASLLKNAGFEVKDLIVVKNLDIDEALKNMLLDPKLSTILCIGGTGISKSDITVEAVEKIIQRHLPGFGELFRFLTYKKWKHLKEKIGILALDTRAMAGVVNNKIIFVIPGSPEATELAVKELIIPGLPTLLGQLRKEE